MQLFHMWKNSLKIFIPRNLKLFSLVSLNAVLQTYKVWLRLLWPLFILYMLAGVVAVYAPMSGALAVAIFNFGLFVTLILAMRPSVKRKTYAYFYDYRWHVAMMAVFFFVDFFVAMEHMYKPFFLAHLFAPVIVIPLTTLMLFYCDTPGRLRDYFASCWRTIKMLWYGLPFYFILTVATGIYYFVISELLWKLFFPFAYILRTMPMNSLYGCFYSLFVSLAIIVFSVVPIGFAATFYTKKLHDYSERFFAGRP